MSACAAAKRMPPPGWTTPESGAEATSPLDLSRLGESKNSHTCMTIGLSMLLIPAAL